MKILDENLGEKWKNYLWQGALAGVSIVMISILLNDVLNLIVIAAVGSTAFVVFAIPHSRTANLRSVIGGHFLCVVAGGLCSFLPIDWLRAGLALILGFFLMVITNSEHPPAAGTALALTESSLLKGSLFILSSVIFLSIIRLILLSRLEDLAG